MGDIKMILAAVAALVLGLAIGLVTMWGIQRIKVNDALTEAANAKLEKANVVTLLNDSLEREQHYKSTIEDTLLIVQLLKQYQTIDEKTREEIESIKETYEDNKPSKDSVEKFRKLLVDIKNRNTEITEPMELPSTGATTDILTLAESVEDLSDEYFIEAIEIFFGDEE